MLRQFFRGRDWHMWVGGLLSIPILAIGVTAIFISHEDDWETGKIVVGEIPPQTFTEEALQERAEHNLQDVKTIFVASDSTEYLGTKGGLLVHQPEGGYVLVEALTGQEIRSVIEAAGRLYVAGKEGTWQREGETWTQIHPDDAKSLSVDGQGRLTLVLEKKGLVRSPDGGTTWEARDEVPAQLAAAVTTALKEDIVRREVARPLSLKRFLLDIHTGKALFSKPYQWLWIDLLGATMILLSLSGVYVWWRRKRKQARLIKA